MFMPSNLPLFAGQPRHQDCAGSGSNQQTAPKKILMAPVYPSLKQTKSSDQNTVNIPLPSGVVRGTTSYFVRCGDSTAGQITKSSTTGIQN